MIAVAAVVAGIVAAALIGMVPPQTAPIDTSPTDAQFEVETTNEAVPDRCRTITTVESGCSAAWDAERRHFFREERP